MLPAQRTHLWLAHRPHQSRSAHHALFLCSHHNHLLCTERWARLRTRRPTWWAHRCLWEGQSQANTRLNTRLSNFNITRRIKFHRNKKQKKCDLLCLFLGCYFAFTYDEAQRINCINCSKTRNMQYFSFRIKALSLFEAITSDVSRQTVLFPFFFSWPSSSNDRDT